MPLHACLGHVRYTLYTRCRTPRATHKIEVNRITPQLPTKLAVDYG